MDIKDLKVFHTIAKEESIAKGIPYSLYDASGDQ